MQDHLGKKVEIKRSDSLSYSTVMVAGVSCIMLGVIALVLGLGLYGKAVADQYITRAFDLAKTASVSATHGANSIQLKPGDSIFLYTDGIPEANDPDQKFLGMDRLKEALNIRPDASCEETVSIVKEVVDEFVKDADQFDDQTMLCFRYYGK